MPEEEKKQKRAIRWKGVRKMFLGALSYIPGLGPAIGIIGAKVALGGVILRGVGKLIGSKSVENVGQNLASIGVKTAVMGATMSIPFVGGALLASEGLYNAAKGEQPCIPGDGIFGIKDIGFEAIAKKAARFVSGLPQFGDLDHNPEKIWQNPSQPSHALDDDVAGQSQQQQPQQQVQQQQPAQQPQVQQQSSQQQPQAAHYQVENRPRPAVQHSEINIAEVTKAASYQEASKAYSEQVNKQSDQKFVVDPKLTKQSADGGMEVTYVPPQYKTDPSQCPENQRVTQTFDKDGNVIEVKAGKEASCITPPVKDGSSFKIHSYENGKAIDHTKPAVGHAQTIRGSVGAPSPATVGPPPPGVHKQSQSVHTK